MEDIEVGKEEVKPYCEHHGHVCWETKGILKKLLVLNLNSANLQDTRSVYKRLYILYSKNAQSENDILKVLFTVA